MTNAERKARRSESARRAAERRRQAKEEARDHRAEQARADELAHQVETAEEKTRREEQAEAKRKANLRHLIAEAQRLDRERDLYVYAQSYRWDHRPGRWTAEQIDELERIILPMGPFGPGKRRWRHPS